MVNPANGILLISDPFLKDPNFMRTVVLLCEHREDGSFGLILNRNFDQTLGDLITELEGYKVPVYYGGPVQVDTLHFLHQLPDKIPGGQEVIKDVYWGGDFDLVIHMLKNKTLDTSRIRFYLGYSGWGSGQLDNELKEKTWLTEKAIAPLIFHKNVNELWKDALKQMGGQFEQLINYPIDPQLN